MENVNAMSTMVGMVDGTGSIFSAGSNLIISRMLDKMLLLFSCKLFRYLFSYISLFLNGLCFIIYRI